MFLDIFTMYLLNVLTLATCKNINSLPSFGYIILHQTRRLVYTKLSHDAQLEFLVEFREYMEMTCELGFCNMKFMNVLHVHNLDIRGFWK